MSKVKFELNSAGVRELLQSAEMSAICKQYADQVASRCGDGYEVTVHTGKTRVNASVHAATFKARRSNLKHNTLLKALGG